MLQGTEKTKSEGVSLYFRAIMAQRGIMIRENETVDEYIRRCGFPYSRQAKGWRHDN